MKIAKERKKKPKQQSGPKYPMATIAYYGPDNVLATKLVVAIIPKANAKTEPELMRKWRSGVIDVRVNEKIGQEVEAFLLENGIKSVVAADRIMGCPHEEGKDYPLGMKCPKCPFWENRNRFTHELES